MGNEEHVVNHEKMGEKIREERKRLHLTQAELAEAIDISDTYMGAIERGERGLTLKTLKKLSGRLGVTVEYLLSEGSVTDTMILEEIEKIIAGQPLERQRLAVNMLRMLFTYFNDNE